jgi:hypothetical protein
MGGGLMQLVAYGAQDIYLTGNPQITFFKVVYRRHTNFSMEAIEQTLLGTTAAGNTQTSTISRNGDLIHRMYLEVQWSDNSFDTLSPGAFMLDTVDLEIGGQLIDRHTGQWMETWAELTEKTRYDNSSGGRTLFSSMSGMGTGDDGVNPTEYYFVPLQFWFCRNPGLALPLIALQYHEVKLKIKWSTKDALDYLSSAKLYVDYIYLDTDERRRFAQVSHEYLIEQLQYQELAATKINEINFNHPVKELIWRHNASSTDSSIMNIATDNKFHIKLNGHDRFSKRPTRYFTHAQVWQYHSGNICDDSPIAVYSFALKPEEHQPSGTCNFSRIDNAQLVSDNDFKNTGEGASGGVIYAVNYNVLRIMSGMGGLAYSN